MKMQNMARQPAISFSISFLLPFNRAGGRTSNVLQNNLISVKTLILLLGLSVAHIDAQDHRMDSIDKILMEKDRQRSELEKCAIFTDSQIRFLKEQIGFKIVDKISIQSVSKLKLPVPISAFVLKYGFPDKTAILQSPPAMCEPSVLWEYGDINVFVGFGRPNKVMILKVVEKVDWNFEQLRKRLAEHSGADHTATKPADKPPVKDQPSTPTSKTGPR